MMRFVFSEECLLHNPSSEFQGLDQRLRPYWEFPGRVSSIREALLRRGFEEIVPTETASPENLLAVHERELIFFLENIYEAWFDRTGREASLVPDSFALRHLTHRPNDPLRQLGYYCLDAQTPIERETWAAALKSASCALTAANLIAAGEKAVYALCRPPGHHTGRNYYGGYCYLNNAAIAGRSLGQDGERVAILDIDYHHGNGTQAIFYTDRAGWYGSLHIDPRTAYPFYAGYEEERGAGAGEGTNWNMPLPPGTDQEGYLDALEALLARLDAFGPRWLVVSAGFDTYVLDPITKFRVTTAGFGEIGQRIRALDLPTLVVQEGGYHVPDLGRNVVALLEALL